MFNRISKTQALDAVTIINTIVILFHILILVQIIPYEYVWGGKLGSVGEMYRFEGVSIAVSLILSAVLLLKAYRIPNNIPPKVLNGILWVFAFLFALNTIENLMAETIFEKAVFTPTTLVLTVLLVFILNDKKNKKKSDW